MIMYLYLGVLVVCVTLLFVKKRMLQRLSYVVWKKAIVLLSALLLIAIINVLSVGFLGSSQNVSNRDIIFLLDLTYSMNAVDGRQGGDDTRLASAKEDIAMIADKNIGAAFGIYAFSNKADILMPLTTNRSDLQEAVDTTYTTGDSDVLPVIGYKDTFNKLKDYLQKQHELDPTRERVVIVLSDFEIYRDNESREDIVAAAASLKQYAGGFGYVVYGKDDGSRLLRTVYDFESGAYVPRYTAFGRKYDEDYMKFVTDNENKSKIVVSKPDAALAQEVAKATGGRVIRYTDSKGFEQIVSDASRAASKKAMTNSTSQSLRQNWIYAPLALILFVWLLLSEIIRPKWLERVFMPRSQKK